MLKKMVQSLFNLLGYNVAKLGAPEVSNVESFNGFDLYQYRKADGTFDYEKYREIQIAGNKRKIESVWVIEENISFLSEYIKKNIKNITFGLCHGTRRGKEQEWFRKHLQCEVIGTEISETAAQFPNTIQWDFHIVKPEWVDSVDFIYSNSFDHSYDPPKCLNAWMSCIKKGGVCILEHTSGGHKSYQLDPFGADVLHMPYLILTWADQKYCVQAILDAPVNKEFLAYTQYLIIKKIGSSAVSGKCR